MKTIYFKSECGAGDIVNVSPLLHYLSNYYEVYADLKPDSVFKLPVKIKLFEKGKKTDFQFNINFDVGINIPAKKLIDEIENTLNIKIPLDKLGPGIFFSKEELDSIERLKSKNYVYISTYTSIKQKRIHPSIVNNYLKSIKSYNVVTHVPKFDNSSDGYDWNAIDNLEMLEPVDYFSREWILQLAGAQRVIACDGGGFNVALATNTPVTGFLTIADESLCLLYPNNDYKVIQSYLKCSPCFKPADYGKKEIIGCLSVDNVCGNNFNLGENNNE